jgi:hypothetical protein
MALIKTRLGTNEDGTPQFHYSQTDPSIPIVFTGPITGQVTIAGGVTYDVSEPFIEVQPGHELLVSNAIGERHQNEGHPDFLADPEVPDFGFVHIPSEV